MPRMEGGMTTIAQPQAPYATVSNSVFSPSFLSGLASGSARTSQAASRLLMKPCPENGAR